MSSRIYLIERNGRFKLLDREAMEYESGYWAVAPDTAEKLVGGEILFHKKQSDPAYYGGVIKNYRIQEDGEWKGRVVFRFIADPQRLRGTDAGQDGWGMEKKIVL
jgi:hypothetical protein